MARSLHFKFVSFFFITGSLIESHIIAFLIFEISLVFKKCFIGTRTQFQV